MSTTKVYKNGNYLVIFNTITGTKVRYNDLDYFEAERPESIDLKITNRCYGVNGVLCAMCHENSNECGKHGDILNLLFIDTMLPYSEVAIGGGDPLTHPDLIPFLEKLKDRNIIANITVNQYTFMNNIDYIKSLVDNKLIYGLGISLNEPTDEFIEMVTQFPNAVVHVICGLVSVA